MIPLSPVMLVEVELLLITVAYVTFSVTMQRKLANVDRMYEIRAKMNTMTKKLMEMSKSSNKEGIMDIQKEITKLSTESMMQQLKSMVVVVPALLVIYYLLLPMGFHNLSVNLPFLSFSLSYKSFFFWTSVIIGFAATMCLNIYDRRRLREKYKFGLLGPSIRQETVNQ